MITANYPAWMRRAACRDVDTFVFFAPDHLRGGPRKAWERTAKAVCDTCPVITACLAYALEHDEAGVWGRTSDDDRRRIRRRRKPAAPIEPAKPVPATGQCFRCRRPMVPQTAWQNGYRPAGHTRKGTAELCASCHSAAQKQRAGAA